MATIMSCKGKIWRILAAVVVLVLLCQALVVMLESADTSTQQPDTPQNVDTSTQQPDTTQSADTSTQQPDTTQSADTSTQHPDTTQSADKSTRQPDTTQSADTSGGKDQEGQSKVPHNKDSLSLGGTVAIGIVIPLTVIAAVLFGAFYYTRYVKGYRGFQIFGEGVRYKTYSNTAYRDDESVEMGGVPRQTLD
ncbi:hypothetical protein ElyMa_000016200 [Elysia marginata]|uniref:Uncharacterized protein n=1 Tax=Elysia marginata TaxID=1093978 RepID=A0AAV4EAK7_9GAST|nr:hypothetical protein ElyMa_000016200 [Elysia marginata]